MNNILFLTLRVFSATGGIEKVSKVAGKTFYEHGIEFNHRVTVMSMHDHQKHAYNNQYFPAEIFLGYNGNRANFIYSALKKALDAKVVVLSHINLLLVGWMIKKISPTTKLILVAHGIEVWDDVSLRNKKMIRCCDKIISVSKYTQDKVIELKGVSVDRGVVLNNCLDPYLPLPLHTNDRMAFLDRYGFEHDDKVIFTLTRINAKEKYKGYDKVLESLAILHKQGQKVRYIISGKYDVEEKQVLDQQIENLGLNGRVILTGFLPDEELPVHLANADVYVMPSKKEGFGIVFIEAMNYGVPVIAGNQDGSSDALLNGELGILVNPDSTEEISAAILNVFTNPKKYMPNRNLLMQNFSYEVYKENLNTIVDRLTQNEK